MSVHSECAPVRTTHASFRVLKNMCRALHSWCTFDHTDCGTLNGLTASGHRCVKCTSSIHAYGGAPAAGSVAASTPTGVCLADRMASPHENQAEAQSSYASEPRPICGGRYACGHAHT